ncbi:poly(R)-hydroxyalkanoic acid synthase subunit PhaE [Bacillus sp. FJAT-45350]|uniref:poly(R)-hydroxyalkanoic acid synthase subunit PhaE n=1 Tax=Bacillus sp. FJAT-45350 TaxID=2011014 RepID=UPI000BB6D268|nr:poly(R)-hydroxyalkanoic acid synthase subunit PhaE [Bacillus sp. FJAT-45350]
MTTEKTTFDPYSLWKDYYQNTESYMEKSLEEMMNKEEFSEWVGRVLDTNLFYKKLIDQTTKQYFEQLNLPTREDISNLSSMVVNLDSKVDNIEDQLEESKDNEPSPAVVKREMTLLKTEVKNLSSKLDEVTQLLKNNKSK